MMGLVEDLDVELDKLERRWKGLEKERDNALAECERLRRLLATAIATIEDLKREESPHV